MRIDSIASIMGARPFSEGAAAIQPATLKTGALSSGIEGVGGLQGIGEIAPLSAPETGASEGSFGATLAQAIDRVNSLQVDADHQAELVATGDAPDLHTAAIAMERADLALQATVQVTQKAIDAYREISRMQV